MMNQVNKKVQKIFMPTEVIQQQRESCSVKKSRRLTTALKYNMALKIHMMVK